MLFLQLPPNWLTQWPHFSFSSYLTFMHHLTRLTSHSLMKLFPSQPLLLHWLYKLSSWLSFAHSACLLMFFLKDHLWSTHTTFSCSALISSITSDVLLKFSALLFLTRTPVYYFQKSFHLFSLHIWYHHHRHHHWTMSLLILLFPYFHPSFSLFGVVTNI